MLPQTGVASPPHRKPKIVLWLQLDHTGEAENCYLQQTIVKIKFRLVIVRRGELRIDLYRSTVEPFCNVSFGLLLKR